MEWLESLVLGAVQGVTEFLPVSSDGHLTITQKAFAWWTGNERSGAENLFFDVMLHVGTLAAILAHYGAVIRTGAQGLLGADDVPPAYRRGAVIRTGLLAIVATLPLIPYAKYKHLIEKSMESLTVTGLGFLVTAVALLVTTRLRGGEKGPAEMTWVDALVIGIAQMFAPLPGVSRSGLTVVAALSRGLSRSWAVGFSLLIAVPAILGATVFEVKDVKRSMLTPDRVSQTVAATIVAGLVGYAAIIWLVKVVRSGRMWYFSVYLIVLGTAVLAASLLSGGSQDARRPTALDRPARSGTAGTGAGGRLGGADGPVDRPHADRARSGDVGTGLETSARDRSARLVLGRPLASRP